MCGTSIVGPAEAGFTGFACREVGGQNDLGSREMIAVLE
jgi:hypothetical protein